ncbi:hypothetical protein DUNSADRAFT_9728 [Dunaliella salina]|uniref:Encoded protein n=1 Tax=Dunaliella salina TaxID=3046 RepID=A0ABQ7GGT7_DUNSA|nr:hypothetical protein DUNSADRAFT_9728 [Dunaliella salina]|eukprot:KAF5833819.1 hypothetical protein DUNSADRAFT_9728 [Dunaliella salina]
MLPNLQVLRLTRFCAPWRGSFFHSLMPLHEASSIREMYLECANGSILYHALPAISKITGLQDLSLSHSDPFQPSLTPLSSLKQLKHLAVKGDFAGLPELLKQLPRLQSLEVSDYPSPSLLAALPQSLMALSVRGSSDCTQIWKHSGL